MDDKKGKLTVVKRAESDDDVPDFYVNSVNFLVSQYELLLRFGLKTEPDIDPQPVANIRMSPQHAKVMTLLLRKNIRAYEKDIGKINVHPQMIKDLDIDEEV